MAVDVHDLRPEAVTAEDPPAGGGDGGRHGLPAFIVVILAVLGWAALPLGGSASPFVVVYGQTASGADTTWVVDADTGQATAGVVDGVASPDGSVVVGATAAGGATALTAVDAVTGEVRWRREVPGEVAVRLVAPDGDTVVLGDPYGGTHEPQARTRTQLVVSHADGTMRAFDLAGNYEPEALSRNGSSLFVISYLPPEAPDRYQVRRLDLSTGEVAGVYTPDEELQQEMGGTARTQVWAPDRSRLYTLYTLPAGGGVQAFVHVLDLDGLWAHCVDLPDAVGAVDERTVALATTPDGEDLYVADLAVGRIIEIDTTTLQVTRSARMARGPVPYEEATAAVTPSGHLVVAAGQELRSLVLSSLRVEMTWTASATVVGVQASGRDVVAVLGSRRVVTFDPVTGSERRAFAIPGTGQIRAAGATSVSAKARPDVLPCAC